MGIYHWLFAVHLNRTKHMNWLFNYSSTVTKYCLFLLLESWALLSLSNGNIWAMNFSKFSRRRDTVGLKLEEPLRSSVLVLASFLLFLSMSSFYISHNCLPFFILRTCKYSLKCYILCTTHFCHMCVGWKILVSGIKR